MIKSGQQLALGQITRCTEDDHDGRAWYLLACLGNLGKVLWTYLHLHCRHNSSTFHSWQSTADSWQLKLWDRQHPRGRLPARESSRPDELLHLDGVSAESVA